MNASRTFTLEVIKRNKEFPFGDVSSADLAEMRQLLKQRLEEACAGKPHVTSIFKLENLAHDSKSKIQNSLELFSKCLPS